MECSRAVSFLVLHTKGHIIYSFVGIATDNCVYLALPYNSGPCLNSKINYFYVVDYDFLRHTTLQLLALHFISGSLPRLELLKVILSLTPLCQFVPHKSFNCTPCITQAGNKKSAQDVTRGRAQAHLLCHGVVQFLCCFPLYVEMIKIDQISISTLKTWLGMFSDSICHYKCF